MKRVISVALCLALAASLCLAPACLAEEAVAFGDAAIAYINYIDANLPDRDCIGGVNYQDAQAWFEAELNKAGYEQVTKTDFTFQRKNRQTGEITEVTAKNLAVTKKGTSGEQIIIGAHYDGTGTGDNGSGAALALAAAVAFANVETYYDLTFVFFSAEEYGLHGSSAYAAAMTDEEVAKTVYEINIDSIACGDFCYIYGGVADVENKTVTDTQAFDNALAVITELGLDIRVNPWTYDSPEPTAKEGVPAYPSPSTGDWSDHVGFYERGIPYIYFEATNWEIGDYDGYEETADHGPMMNTENDKLAIIEEYFPGRVADHLQTFSQLLKALLEQSELNW